MNKRTIRITSIAIVIIIIVLVLVYMLINASSMNNNKKHEIQNNMLINTNKNITYGVVNSKENKANNMNIKVNNKTYTATLYDNNTVSEFKKILPMTVTMHDVNSNEKAYYLPQSIYTSARVPLKINKGDIMLYGSDCLVLFYESFSTSYMYTLLGRIDNSNGLKSELGRGEITVTFELE